MNSIAIDEEIELINDIIDSAIYHGGDSGGAYNSDGHSLESSIGEWLYAKGIDTSFAACENAIRPIEEININDYCKADKIWYCFIEDYQVDEICKEGLVSYRKGVHIQISQGKKSDVCGRHSGYHREGEAYKYAVIDVANAFGSGKSKFYCCKFEGYWKRGESFFVDYVAPECFKIETAIYKTREKR